MAANWSAIFNQGADAARPEDKRGESKEDTDNEQALPVR